MINDAARIILSPIAKAIFRPTVQGLENIPKKGPVIFASNHLSFVDSVVIPLLTPRQVSFLAKQEYFTGKGVRGMLSRWFFTSIKAIPVERGTVNSAQASLDRMLAVLRKGGACGIYPEGTRSRDGRLYKGKGGVAWLAMEANATVIPVGLADTHLLQPVGSRIPRLAHVTVKFGKALDFSDLDPKLPAAKARQARVDRIMNAIHELTGQPLANAYNEPPRLTAGS